MKRKRRPTNLRPLFKEIKSNESNDDIEYTRIKAVIEHKRLQSEQRQKKPAIYNDTYLSNDNIIENNFNDSEEEGEVSQYKISSIRQSTAIKNSNGEDISSLHKDYTNLDSNFVQASLQSKEELLMMKYVEERIKNNHQGKVLESCFESQEKNPLENFIKNAPDYLKSVKKLKISEDMLSSQMLTGIPEVNLGIDNKIKNIEALERVMASKSTEKSKESKLQSKASTINNPYFSKRFLTNNNNIKPT